MSATMHSHPSTRIQVLETLLDSPACAYVTKLATLFVRWRLIEITLLLIRAEVEEPGRWSWRLAREAHRLSTLLDALREKPLTNPPSHDILTVEKERNPSLMKIKASEEVLAKAFKDRILCANCAFMLPRKDFSLGNECSCPALASKDYVLGNLHSRYCAEINREGSCLQFKEKPHGT